MHVLRPTLCTTALGLIATSGLPGCGPAEPTDLALPEDWSLVDPPDDPWPGVPDDALPCPDRALLIEAGTLELDTARCGWITATAPSRIRVRQGDPIDVFTFHAALTADAPAEAVFGVRIGDSPLWTLRKPVPAAQAFYEERVEAPVDIDEGTPLWVHAHNHGANTYRLGHLRARPRR